MTSAFTIPAKPFEGFTGYIADPVNCPPDKLSRPSLNCVINPNGDAESRLGYTVLDDTLDLNQPGLPATSYYCETYDLTFFAIGTTVQYYDWTTQVLYDTGLTLTTGTVTRFAEYLGDIYMSNTTDGLRRIVVGRLNGAVTVGASSITVDVDMAARLSVFSVTSGSLRINGVGEAFNAVTISTGALTLTGTASASYLDNAIAVVVLDISSSKEKASKILFWKERIHLMGFPNATNADQPNNSIICGQFVIGQTGTSGIELILDFTFGTGGSTKIVVGKGGKLTNIVGAKDFIYFFMQQQAYATNASDISTDSASGSIGLTIPELRDENHGCLNEDSACVIGNNELSYITNDKRIIRIKIATDTGAPVVFPDEGFDVPLTKDLQEMDDDQTGSLCFYHRGGRRSIYQLRRGGQFYWYIFDHQKNCWFPPQQVVAVASFFERKGVLYGTDAADDTVYCFDASFADNGQAFSCIIATGEFDVDDAQLQVCSMKGIITQPTVIQLRSLVKNTRGGTQSGSAKLIDGSTFSYGEDRSIGAVAIGNSSSGERAQTADWKRTFDIYPSEAHTVQVTASSDCEAGHFSVARYQITGTGYSNSFSSSL